MPLLGVLIKLFAETLVAVAGQKLGEHLASEVVCAAAKGCPQKTDEIATSAKAKAEARTVR